MVNLVFNLYLSDDPKRREELAIALDLNQSANLRLIPIIERGVPLSEFALSKETLKYVNTLENTPYFGDLFNIADFYTKDDDVAIISNMDIVFDNKAIALIEATLEETACYALTRYDMIDGDTENAVFIGRIDSQDAWCFKGHAPNIGSMFYPGVPGCDNRLAHIIHMMGYKILNPSKSIRTYHYHLSNHRTRTNTDRVQPPYKCLPPHFIGEDLPHV